LSVKLGKILALAVLWALPSGGLLRAREDGVAEAPPGVSGFELRFPNQGQSPGKLVPGEPVDFLLALRLSDGSERDPTAEELEKVTISSDQELVRVDRAARKLIPSADRSLIDGRSYRLKASLVIGGKPFEAPVVDFSPDIAALYGPEPDDVDGPLEVVLRHGDVNGSLVQTPDCLHPEETYLLEVSVKDRSGRTYYSGPWLPRLPLFRLGFDVRPVNAWSPSTAELRLPRESSGRASIAVTYLGIGSVAEKMLLFDVCQQK
jgi:hypothetical protein